MKKTFLPMIITLLITSSTFLLTSCSDDDNPVATTEAKPTANFAVFSDPHFYDVSLGTTGSAFEAYLAEDRKLIAESEALTKSLVSNLTSEKLDFILIAGDLTKDGELSSHQKFASYLSTLEAQGKKVYVVPGNHDVNNPQAYSFSGSTTSKVASVSKDEFSTIYANYGYSEALERDPNSLSYVAEPKTGIWLIAIDACRYSENTTSSVTGGKLSTATLDWILKKIKEGKDKGKIVMGMMHHGVLEHYTGQKTLFGEYVVDDYANISQKFAEAGMNIVFTGHYHAQDIAAKTFSSNFIYDIETGSLVTYPCPYRIINLSEDKKLTITSKSITTIDYNTNGKTFQDYAKGYLELGMNGLATYMLVNQYGVSAAMAGQVAPLIAAGFVAHYAGDETPTSTTLTFIQSMLSSSDPTSLFLGQALGALWTDLTPKDNNLIIDLTTGSTVSQSLLKNNLSFNF